MMSNNVGCRFTASCKNHECHHDCDRLHFFLANASVQGLPRPGGNTSGTGCSANPAGEMHPRDPSTGSGTSSSSWGSPAADRLAPLTKSPSFCLLPRVAFRSRTLCVWTAYFANAGGNFANAKGPNAESLVVLGRGRAHSVPVGYATDRRRPGGAANGGAAPETPVC